VGPLRAPLYRPTAYLDFSGVNANTEAEPRYSRLPPVDAAICADRLRRFFLSGVLPPKDPIGRIGLALQVEDDSNLVAFGNGFDNQAAAVYVRLTHGDEGPIAIRAHPGSLFKIRGASWFETDESYDSMEFIQRCKRIVNVNSSLGLEAVLLGTPVTVLGECSYKFILDVADEKERLARLAFYLFAYLFSNLGAWGVVLAVERTEGGGLQIVDYAGLSRRRPGLALAMGLFMLSLTGLPPTVGFVGKFFIFRAALDAGQIGLAVVGVLTSVVSAYYYLRVVVVMYMRSGEPETRSEGWLNATIGVAALATFVFGILPGPVLALAENSGILGVLR